MPNRFPYIELVAALKPADINDYLSGRKWKIAKQKEEKIIWMFNDDPSKNILLPLKRDYVDYVDRKIQFIEDLALIEKRPVIQIINDIAAINNDVIRIRLHGIDTVDGCIPLFQGAEMIEKSYEMILAAACASVKPMPIYQGQRYKQAMEYIKNVKLGQTEIGSYVITAHSPISRSAQMSLDQNADESFERRVIRTFVNAVQSAKEATRQSLEAGNVNIFRQFVENGVSANLCEAIADIRSIDETADLSFDISWSPYFSTPKDLPTHFDFAANEIPVLRDAAELFREKIPLTDFFLKGIIHKLERHQKDGPGIIVVASFSEDYEGKMIRVALSADDYNKAIKAHEEFAVMSCYGRLRKEGSFWYLDDYRDFITEEVIRATPN